MEPSPREAGVPFGISAAKRCGMTDAALVVQGPNITSSVNDRSPSEGGLGPLKYFSPLLARYHPNRPPIGSLASTTQSRMPLRKRKRPMAPAHRLKSARERQ